MIEYSQNVKLRPPLLGPSECNWDAKVSRKLGAEYLNPADATACHFSPTKTRVRGMLTNGNMSRTGRGVAGASEPKC